MKPTKVIRMKPTIFDVQLDTKLIDIFHRMGEEGAASYSIALQDDQGQPLAAVVLLYGKETKGYLDALGRHSDQND